MADEKLHAYYCSRKWGLKKEAVHARSNGICERCQVNKGQAVHHKTYIRLYDEELDDLIHLCEGCHKFEHGRSDFDPAKPINYKKSFSNSIDAHNVNPPFSNSVVCPECGEANIHHCEIVTYERAEDAKLVNKTTITGTRTNFEKSVDGFGNPSLRRNGMTIEFYCEHCPAISKLCIHQHKGTTFMYWDVTTKRGNSR